MIHSARNSWFAAGALACLLAFASRDASAQPDPAGTSVAETIEFPTTGGLTAHALTLMAWAASVLSSSPDRASQSLSVQSMLADTMNLPSGLTAHAVILAS